MQQARTSIRAKVAVQTDMFSGKARKVKVKTIRPVTCECGRRAISNGLCEYHHPDV